MELLVFLQALEPRGLFRLVFSAISWWGDGPVYLLLFPVLYWVKSRSIAVRYGYLWGASALVMTVLKEQTDTLRPFLAAPEQVAFLQYPLAGLYWFPTHDTLRDVYRHSSSFPSGHALFAASLGMYLLSHTAVAGLRWLLAFFIVMIPLARLYLGVHYLPDVLAGSGLGLLLFVLATRVKWEALRNRLARAGLQRWHQHVILVMTLGGILVLLSKAATFVLLIFLSYPLILTLAEKPIRSFAAESRAAWKTYNAVGGCLGVGVMLWATAPLLSLGTLGSVPLVTVWVTLGCPLMVQTMRKTMGARR
jgi:membrane-associated phospholipid phosphatase